MRVSSHFPLVGKDAKVNVLQTIAPIAPASSKAPVHAHPVSVYILSGVKVSKHISGFVPSGMTKAILSKIKLTVRPMLR